MARVRVDRVKEQIKKELSHILQTGMKDRRIGFVTVTAVELSRDLKVAKVFVSIFCEDREDDTEKKETLATLEKAKGYLRSEIGQRIQLRYIPELVFVEDQSLDYSEHINQLLDDVQQDKTPDGLE